MHSSQRALVLIPLGASLLALGQVTPHTTRPDPAVPRVLNSTGTVGFEIPAFGSRGKPLCDASGNLYFDVSEINPMVLHHTGPYLKIEADGRRHQIFTPHFSTRQEEDPATPGTGDPKDSDGIEGVSPDGTFYLLLHDSTGDELQRFKEDGSFAGSTRLELPSGLILTHWSIQDSGFAYVAGYFESSDSHSANGFGALVAPSGKIIANLSESASSVHSEPGPARPTEGDVMAGSDGKFYILEANKIFAVTQSGQIENVFSFTKPDPEALSVRIDVSGGLISILFYTFPASQGVPSIPESSAMLLNSQTGELLHTIKFAKPLTNSVVCFQSNEGYSMLTVENQMAAKAIVPIR